MSKVTLNLFRNSIVFYSRAADRVTRLEEKQRTLDFLDVATRNHTIKRLQNIANASEIIYNLLTFTLDYLTTVVIIILTQDTF